MTDTDPTPNPALNTDACEAKAREQAGLSESIHVANKASLFDALARTGITIVTVSFDGYGDSGQIEEIQAKAGDAPVELPPAKSSFSRRSMAAPELNARHSTSARRSKVSLTISSRRRMAPGGMMTAPMATSPSTSRSGRSRSTTTSALRSPNISTMNFKEGDEWDILIIMPSPR